MTQSSTCPDVIVIGGGVIGLSIAWELAQAGVSVRVLEQAQFGQEASWAGAGILPPGNPERANSSESWLRAGSHVLWPDWSQRLLAQTGIDNGFIRCGGLEVHLSDDEPLDSRITAWKTEGVQVEPLSGDGLRRYVPHLTPEIRSGYRLPDLGQVRNPRHLKALYQACAASNVDLRTGCPVTDFVRKGDRIAAVQTAAEVHSAAEYIVASGAWSSILLQRAGHATPVEPIRGQIVLLQQQRVLFRHVIEVGSRYLVPRADGRILIGSTEERVGFEKANTAGAVADLIQFAERIVPELRSARFERCWSGLRPHAPNGLPLIGRLPESANLSMAAGHFRAGLQLSPATAVLMRQLILRQPTSHWAAALSPGSPRQDTSSAIT